MESQNQTLQQTVRATDEMASTTRKHDNGHFLQKFLLFSGKNPKEILNWILQIENTMGNTKRNILDLALSNAKGSVLKTLKKCKQ